MRRPGARSWPSWRRDLGAPADGRRGRRARPPITRPRCSPRAASWRCWMPSPSWAARRGHGRADRPRRCTRRSSAPGLANAASLGIAAALTGPLRSRRRADGGAASRRHRPAGARLPPSLYRGRCPTTDRASAGARGDHRRRAGSPQLRDLLNPDRRPAIRRRAGPRPHRRACRSHRRPGTIDGMQHEVSAFHGTERADPVRAARQPASRARVRGCCGCSATPSGQAPRPCVPRPAAQPVRAIRAATRGAQPPRRPSIANGGSRA